MTKMPDRKRTVEQVVSARAAKQQSDFHIDTENRVANLERRGSGPHVMRSLYRIWSYGSDPLSPDVPYYGICGHGSTVYYSHDSGGVSAYDINSGDRLWWTDLSALEWTSFLAATGTHVFGSNGAGDVYVFDSSDGTLIGTFTSPDSTTQRANALCVHEETDRLYVCTYPSSPNTQDGIIWQLDISDPTSISLVDSCSGIYTSSDIEALHGICVSDEGDRVYCAVNNFIPGLEWGVAGVDTSDMSVAWSNYTGSERSDSVAITSDGATLWVYAYGLRAHDASDGTAIDDYPMGDFLSQEHASEPETDKYQCIALLEDKWLFISDTYDGYYVYVVDITTGRWVHVFDWYEVNSTPSGGTIAIVDGKVAIAETSGGINVMGAVPTSRITSSTLPDVSADPLWTETFS